MPILPTGGRVQLGLNVGGFHGNVAQAIAVTATAALGGPSAGNYSLVQPIGLAANITPQSLTVGGSSVAANKVYDGNTTAVVSGGQLLGVITGDPVTLAQSGIFASRNVGTGLVVTATDSLGGAAAANYSLLQPIVQAATISPKLLRLSRPKVSAKDYDGNTSATVTGSKISGLVAGDVVELAQTAQFVDRNAGQGKAVVYSNHLTGADAGNYAPASAFGTVKATIKPLLLLVDDGFATAADKTFDGTTAATISGSTIDGVVAGDRVVLAQSGKFLNAAIGADKLVIFKNALLGRDQASYRLSSSGGRTTAEILAP